MFSAINRRASVVFYLSLFSSSPILLSFTQFFHPSHAFCVHPVSVYRFVAPNWSCYSRGWASISERPTLGQKWHDDFSQVGNRRPSQARINQCSSSCLAFPFLFTSLSVSAERFSSRCYNSFNTYTCHSHFSHILLFWLNLVKPVKNMSRSL